MKRSEWVFAVTPHKVILTHTTFRAVATEWFISLPFVEWPLTRFSIGYRLWSWIINAADNHGKEVMRIPITPEAFAALSGEPCWCQECHNDTT